MITDRQNFLSLPQKGSSKKKKKEKGSWFGNKCFFPKKGVGVGSCRDHLLSQRSAIACRKRHWDSPCIRTTYIFLLLFQNNYFFYILCTYIIDIETLCVFEQLIFSCFLSFFEDTISFTFYIHIHYRHWDSPCIRTTYIFLLFEFFWRYYFFYIL